MSNFYNKDNVSKNLEKGNYNRNQVEWESSISRLIQRTNQNLNSLAARYGNASSGGTRADSVGSRSLRGTASGVSAANYLSRAQEQRAQQQPVDNPFRGRLAAQYDRVRQSIPEPPSNSATPSAITALGKRTPPPSVLDSARGAATAPPAPPPAGAGVSTYTGPSLEEIETRLRAQMQREMDDRNKVMENAIEALRQQGEAMADDLRKVRQEVTGALQMTEAQGTYINALQNDVNSRRGTLARLEGWCADEEAWRARIDVAVAGTSDEVRSLSQRLESQQLSLSDRATRSDLKQTLDNVNLAASAAVSAAMTPLQAHMQREIEALRRQVAALRIGRTEPGTMSDQEIQLALTSDNPSEELVKGMVSQAMSDTEEKLERKLSSQILAQMKSEGIDITQTVREEALEAVRREVRAAGIYGDKDGGPSFAERERIARQSVENEVKQLYQKLEDYTAVLFDLQSQQGEVARTAERQGAQAEKRVDEAMAIFENTTNELKETSRDLSKRLRDAEIHTAETGEKTKNEVAAKFQESLSEWNTAESDLRRRIELNEASVQSFAETVTVSRETVENFVRDSIDIQRAIETSKGMPELYSKVEQLLRDVDQAKFDLRDGASLSASHSDLIRDATAGLSALREKAESLSERLNRMERDTEDTKRELRDAHERASQRTEDKFLSSTQQIERLKRDAEHNQVEVANIDQRLSNLKQEIQDKMNTIDERSQESKQKLEGCQSELKQLSEESLSSKTSVESTFDDLKSKHRADKDQMEDRVRDLEARLRDEIRVEHTRASKIEVTLRGELGEQHKHFSEQLKDTKTSLKDNLKDSNNRITAIEGSRAQNSELQLLRDRVQKFDPVWPEISAIKDKANSVDVVKTNMEHLKEHFKNLEQRILREIEQIQTQSKMLIDTLDQRVQKDIDHLQSQSKSWMMGKPLGAGKRRPKQAEYLSDSSDFDTPPTKLKYNKASKIPARQKSSEEPKLQQLPEDHAEEEFTVEYQDPKEAGVKDDAPAVYRPPSPTPSEKSLYEVSEDDGLSHMGSLMSQRPSLNKLAGHVSKQETSQKSLLPTADEAGMISDSSAEPGMFFGKQSGRLGAQDDDHVDSKELSQSEDHSIHPERQVDAQLEEESKPSKNDLAESGKGTAPQSEDLQSLGAPSIPGMDIKSSRSNLNSFDNSLDGSYDDEFSVNIQTPKEENVCESAEQQQDNASMERPKSFSLEAEEIQSLGAPSIPGMDIKSSRSNLNSFDNSFDGSYDDDFSVNNQKSPLKRNSIENNEKENKPLDEETQENREVQPIDLGLGPDDVVVSDDSSIQDEVEQATPAEQPGGKVNLEALPQGGNIKTDVVANSFDNSFDNSYNSFDELEQDSKELNKSGVIPSAQASPSNLERISEAEEVEKDRPTTSGTMNFSDDDSSDPEDSRPSEIAKAEEGGKDRPTTIGTMNFSDDDSDEPEDSQPSKTEEVAKRESPSAIATLDFSDDEWSDGPKPPEAEKVEKKETPATTTLDFSDDEWSDGPRPPEAEKVTGLASSIEKQDKPITDVAPLSFSDDEWSDGPKPPGSEKMEEETKNIGNPQGPTKVGTMNFSDDDSSDDDEGKKPGEVNKTPDLGFDSEEEFGTKSLSEDSPTEVDQGTLPLPDPLTKSRSGGMFPDSTTSPISDKDEVLQGTMPFSTPAVVGNMNYNDDSDHSDDLSVIDDLEDEFNKPSGTANKSANKADDIAVEDSFSELDDPTTIADKPLGAQRPTEPSTLGDDFDNSFDVASINEDEGPKPVSFTNNGDSATKPLNFSSEDSFGGQSDEKAKASNKPTGGVASQLFNQEGSLQSFNFSSDEESDDDVAHLHKPANKEIDNKLQPVTSVSSPQSFDVSSIGSIPEIGEIQSTPADSPDKNTSPAANAASDPLGENIQTNEGASLKPRASSIDSSSSDDEPPLQPSSSITRANESGSENSDSDDGKPKMTAAQMFLANRRKKVETSSSDSESDS